MMNLNKVTSDLSPKNILEKNSQYDVANVALGGNVKEVTNDGSSESALNSASRENNNYAFEPFLRVHGRFSTVLMLVATVAIIVCASSRNRTLHFYNTSRIFSEDQVQAKHHDNYGHLHENKDGQKRLLNESSHDSMDADLVNESISVFDVVDASVVNFMYKQQDIIKLLQMKRNQRVKGTGLSAGMKVKQRFTMLSIWASLSNHKEPFPENDECSWEGVDCWYGRVERLEYPRRGWDGSIPSIIGKLKELTYIDFSENKIKGSIPEELYQLEDLYEIYLHNNKMTGTLSESISNLYYLRNLFLCRNKFSGTLPRGLEGTSLRYLSLCYNQLNGALPGGLELDDLYYMDLSFNDFSGRIDSNVFKNFGGLDHLYLDHNGFRGTIPESLVTAGGGNIQQLYLSHNKFSGEFPSPSRWTWGNNKLITLEIQKTNIDWIGKDVCSMSVFDEGDLVELSAECDVCRCSSSTEMCEYC